MHSMGSPLELLLSIFSSSFHMEFAVSSLFLTLGIC
uniref:Uncharacterized protein n=1 Tax=Arundo donax TaxID=35708 RepID=A0A0A9AZH5_ARUDO